MDYIIEQHEEPTFRMGNVVFSFYKGEVRKFIVSDVYKSFRFFLYKRTDSNYPSISSDWKYILYDEKTKNRIPDYMEHQLFLTEEKAWEDYNKSLINKNIPKEDCEAAELFLNTPANKLKIRQRSELSIRWKRFLIDLRKLISYPYGHL